MLNLALLLLQEVVTPETRAARGLDPFALTFMLTSMLAVTALTVWCFTRILRGKKHFDPDGTGPAHAPVPGRVEGRPHEGGTEHEMRAGQRGRCSARAR